MLFRESISGAVCHLTRPLTGVLIAGRWEDLGHSKETINGGLIPRAIFVSLSAAVLTSSVTPRYRGERIVSVLIFIKEKWQGRFCRRMTQILNRRPPGRPIPFMAD